MLRPRHTTLLLALLLTAAVAAVVFWQVRATGKLREEVAALREPRAASVADASAPMPTQPEFAAETVTGTPAAITNWQAEVEKLRQEVAEAEVPADSDPARRPAGARSNRGGASAFDAFETILWAATGGEVGELEKWIAFSPEATEAAARFFETLPPEMRAEFPDARRLIATMMASRLPLNIAQAELLESRMLDSGGASLRLRITRAGPAAKTRELQLGFQRSAAGWQLLVPREIIEGYQYLLIGSPAKPDGANAPTQSSPRPIR